MISRFTSSKDFDSVLHSANPRNISHLTILLRVHLHAHNPASEEATEGNVRDSGIRYRYQRWKPAEWATYQREFKRDVELYLNWPSMGLWLLPTRLDRRDDAVAEYDALFNDKPISKRFNPTVQCGISVTLVNSVKESHVAFDVLRLRDDQPDFGSYTEYHARARDFGVLTHRDIDLWAPRKKGIHQNVVSHEVGHALGLDHSNIKHPRCRNGNERICYGRKGTPQYRNWMGHGDEVTAANAMPWLSAIYRHSRSLIWDATDQMPKEMHFLM